MFWRLAAEFVIVAAAAGGTIAHMVPLLTDRGIAASTATGVLSAAGLALVAGELLAAICSTGSSRLTWPSPSSSRRWWASSCSSSGRNNFRRGDRDRARRHWAWCGSGPDRVPLVAGTLYACLWRDLTDICSPSSCWVQAPGLSRWASLPCHRLISIDAGCFRRSPCSWRAVSCWVWDPMCIRRDLRALAMKDIVVRRPRMPCRRRTARLERDCCG